MTIICYGDSNTYGYDPRMGGSGRYEKDSRWTEILQQNLHTKVENHGICGRCIPHMSGHLEVVYNEVKTWIAREGSIELWIMLGTNDLLQEKEFLAEDVAARMDEFLQKILADSTNLKIRLIAPPLMQYGAWVSEERIYQESRRLGRVYQKVAEKWQLDFTDAGKWELPVVFDGVHLSEKGHQRFAACLWEALRQEQKQL